MDVEPDAAGGFGDERGLLEGVVDALDGVVAHRQEEAGGELRPRRGRVEHGRGGVREELLRHHVVRLDGVVDVLAVDANGDAHEHVLRPLHHLPVDLEQVAPLERLEAEVLVGEVAVVDDGGVEAVGVLLDDLVVELGDHGGGLAVRRHLVEVLHHLREDLLGLLVEVGHHDPGGQDGVVGVLGGHGGGDLGGQVVQLDGGHAGVEPGDDLERDGGRVDVVHVEAVAELLDPRGDLVEVDGLLAPVALQDEHAREELLLHHLEVGGVCLWDVPEGALSVDSVGGDLGREAGVGENLYQA